MILVCGFLKVSDNPAKFRGHKHCGSGDNTILAYHVISQDHVIKDYVTL